MDALADPPQLNAVSPPIPPPSPFNKPGADVVLRSLDGVEFLVRSHILIEASPWFEAQLSPLTSAQTHLELDAHSITLQTLLNICYPIPKPKSERSFGDIETALRVAVKYKLELPIAVLEEELVELARRGSPLEVWALACRMDREDLGRRAVECTFHDDNFDASRICTLQGVSAGDYYRLREYCRLYGKVTPRFALCRPPPGFPEGSIQLGSPVSASTELSSDELVMICSSVSDSPSKTVHRPQAFTSTIPYPDLVCIASDGVDLTVHLRIITGASSTISEMLSQQNISTTSVYETASKSTKKTASKPLKKYPRCPILPDISVAEHSTVLATLFQLCYPGEHTLPIDPSACLAALAAAGRLGMPRIIAELESHWRLLVYRDGLRAYFAAARTGHKAYAEEAAKRVLVGGLGGQYIAEMENTPALPYHILTTYYDKCRAAAKALLRDACIGQVDVSSSRHPIPESSGRTTLVCSGLTTPDSDSGDYIKSTSEVWLRDYIAGLHTEVDEHPGMMPSGAPEAMFKQASVSGQWCRSCEGFARQLSSVAEALQNIPSAVEKVKFEWA